MPTYTVRRGEGLSSIAQAHGFRDNGAAIWDANPKLRESSGGNPEVLQEGWELEVPDFHAKTQKVAAGSTAHVRVCASAQGLSVSLRDPDGKALSGWEYTATASGMPTEKGKSSASGEIRIRKLPPGTKKVLLEVQDSTLMGAWDFPAEKITLHLGDMDPLKGDAKFATIATKKLLVNLGYSPGAIDGAATPQFRGAVAAFQADAHISPAHGLADQTTCEKLLVAANVRAAKPVAHEKPPESGPDSPLTDAQMAGSSNEDVTRFSKYVEPTDKHQTNEQPLKKFLFLPQEAYVAATDAGKQGPWNVNVIQMPARRFIFLDSGKWLADWGHVSYARTFGLIWGRHTYLCRYFPVRDGAPAAKAIEFKRKTGLDHAFFDAFQGQVEIVNYASAAWAPSNDFDWGKLIVVIPDLHLMEGSTAKIWFDLPGPYQFHAEHDLLAFSNSLIALDAKIGKIHVVQIGDSYDLWVNCTPRMFQKNPRVEMILQESDETPAPEGMVEGFVRLMKDESGGSAKAEAEEEARRPASKGKAIEKIKSWITAIQHAGSIDSRSDGPAQKAFLALENSLGGRMAYLYGNHDNYLIDHALCESAKLRQRLRHWESPGIFIEHGHRMEARFFGMRDLGLPRWNEVPHNHDGDPTGYDKTVETFIGMKTGGKAAKKWGSALKEGADFWADYFQQPDYWGEQAQVWLGRQAAGGNLKPAHICVIGHTHIPLLRTIKIRAHRGLA